LARTDFSLESLSKFSHDQSIAFPLELSRLKDKARWILENHEKAWNAWRCEQIVDMVKSIAKVVKAANPNALLGIFAVPWRFEDFDKAVIWAVAQDIERIAPYVDAISPMGYHGMCGRPVRWISEITADLYAARVLHASECGIFSFALSIGYLVSTIMDFGFDPLCVKWVAREKTSRFFIGKHHGTVTVLMEFGLI